MKNLFALAFLAVFASAEGIQAQKKMDKDLMASAEKIEEKVMACGRDFPQHPELSNR